MLTCIKVQSEPLTAPACIQVALDIEDYAYGGQLRPGEVPLVEAS